MGIKETIKDQKVPIFEWMPLRKSADVSTGQSCDLEILYKFV